VRESKREKNRKKNRKREGGHEVHYRTLTQDEAMEKK